MKLHQKLFRYFPNSLARFLRAIQPITVCYVFLITTLLHAQVNYINSPSPYHDVVGLGGMAVSQNKESSKLGLANLNAGCNAIDTAVGLGFSLAITLPRAGNLGGGSFMLAYMDGEVTAIDYRGAASLSIA